MTPRPDGSGCFEALVRLENPAESDEWEVGDNYLWCPLPPPPPPPCVNAANYKVPSRGEIRGYAAAGDGDTYILISTTTYGTYSFDTATSA